MGSKGKHKSPETIRAYTHALSSLTASLMAYDEEPVLSSVTHTAVLRWVKGLQDAGKSRNTVSAWLAAVLVLVGLAWSLLGDLPDHDDRTLAVAPTPGGCVLLVHRVRHELPMADCKKVGEILVQIAEKHGGG